MNDDDDDDDGNNRDRPAAVKFDPALPQPTLTPIRKSKPPPQPQRRLHAKQHPLPLSSSSRPNYPKHVLLLNHHHRADSPSLSCSSSSSSSSSSYSASSASSSNSSSVIEIDGMSPPSLLLMDDNHVSPPRHGSVVVVQSSGSCTAEELRHAKRPRTTLAVMEEEEDPKPVRPTTSGRSRACGAFRTQRNNNEKHHHGTSSSTPTTAASSQGNETKKKKPDAVAAASGNRLGNDFPAAAAEEEENEKEWKDNNERVKRFGTEVLSTFPYHLMEMLDTGVEKAALWWLDSGDSFCVVPKYFTSQLLNKHFQGTKFDSFIRKLNRWGFKRATGLDVASNGMTFYHPHFIRGETDLSHVVQCAKRCRKHESTAVIAGEEKDDNGKEEEEENVSSPLHRITNQKLPDGFTSASQGIRDSSSNGTSGNIAATLGLIPSTLSRGTILPCGGIYLPPHVVASALSSSIHQDLLIQSPLSTRRNNNELQLFRQQESCHKHFASAVAASEGPTHSSALQLRAPTHSLALQLGGPTHSAELQRNAALPLVLSRTRFPCYDGSRSIHRVPGPVPLPPPALVPTPFLSLPVPTSHSRAPTRVLNGNAAEGPYRTTNIDPSVLRRLLQEYQSTSTHYHTY